MRVRLIRYGVVLCLGLTMLAMTLALLGSARPASAQQWISYNSDPKNILEGNWQSCQQSDGQ